MGIVTPWRKYTKKRQWKDQKRSAALLLLPLFILLLSAGIVSPARAADFVQGFFIEAALPPTPAGYLGSVSRRTMNEATKNLTSSSVRAQSVKQWECAAQPTTILYTGGIQTFG